MVYIGTSNGTLSALDTNTGSVKWHFQAGDAIVSTPVVENGIVYFGSFDHYAYALDAASGAFRWRTQLDFQARSPAVEHGVIYISTADTIYALDAATGAIKWHVATHFATATPVVANGTVYVSAVPVLALNAADGSIKWTFAHDDAFGGLVLSPQHDVLYVADSGTLHALRAADGTSVWTTHTAPRVGSGIRDTPAVGLDGTIYVSADAVEAFDATTGALRFDSLHDWQVSTGPTIANGLVYVGTGDRSGGAVKAYDSADGSVKWTYVLSLASDFATSPPAVGP